MPASRLFAPEKFTCGCNIKARPFVEKGFRVNCFSRGSVWVPPRCSRGRILLHLYFYLLYCSPYSVSATLCTRCDQRIRDYEFLLHKVCSCEMF